MIDWNSLTSGLVGAIIGAIIGALATYFAAIKGAKISIFESAKVDLKRRRLDEINLRKSMLNALLAEIDDNLKLAEKIQIQHAKIRFLNDAYEQIKKRIDFLNGELILLTREAYAEASRFNTLADYDQANINKAGSFDKDLNEQAEVAKEAFQKSKKSLEQLV